MKKNFDFKEIEDKYYKIWEEEGFFELKKNKVNNENKNFSIMMPPPNVTGSLHIGHSLTFTLQDILVRYKRMDGFNTLWQAGTDHAGIATQNIVEKQLAEEGLKKEDLGREKFLERVWEWKEKSGGTIVHQLRKLGVSPAWSRERFTMDAGLQKAVKKAFKKLYDEKLIIKANYMVNWCPKDGAISDIEVEYEEKEGKLYHLKYFFKEDKNKFLILATTRPETYFGDTAVMVHPDDERYKNLIGKTLILPLINKEIKIIADDYVDMSFGTGAVKVTPAHDINDYEVGKRHNLEFITVFDKNGILNEYAGEFQGQDRLEAREKIVKKLEENNFIDKIEKHLHKVGVSYRSKLIVEPMISEQWFLKKEIAEKSIKAVANGELKFFPKTWLNNYNAWMNDLRDWCISRQLWWGHQIPVFYCDECKNEWADENDEVNTCPKCNSKNIKQDPDVLDTWFSSALWAFSPLGWGNGDSSSEKFNEDDLKNFYPNSLLITGFDILFFWVARMMMMGNHFLGQVPFKDVYLHALVRDENGHKMSKSKGNVIDPLDSINQYGTDVLRFTLAILAVQGRDIKLSNDKLELSRNFTNKLYNATKFLLMHSDEFSDLENIQVKTALGKYMLSRFNLASLEVRKALDEYKFNDASMILYRFLWGEFCDWAIELSKAEKSSILELGAIFKESLKLLSPFMPFLTEYLYNTLSNKIFEENKENSLMLKDFPKVQDRDLNIEAEFSKVIESIISLRRLKATIEMAGQKLEKAFVKVNLSEEYKTYISLLSKISEINFISESYKSKSVSDISDNLETYLPLDNIDLKPIIKRLNNQKEKLLKNIEKLDKQLSNENYVKNAPKQVVEKSTKELSDLQNKLNSINEELKKF